MVNKLKMNELETIRGLKRLGWSERKISRETGHHRNTVKNIVSAKTNIINEMSKNGTFSSTPGKTSSIALKSKALPHQKFIEDQLKYDVNAKTIYIRLKYEHGYQGSYYSIKRFVRKLKGKSPHIIGWMESMPGQEAQVDFGTGAPVIDLTTGKSRKPYLFKMVLCCSRHSYEEVVWRQDTKTFIQCHINAFNSFGGVTEIVRIDNLKAGIVSCSWHDAEENPLYMAFARHYGFVIVPCKPTIARHKGKVESGIGYTQNALKGKKFTSLQEQNDYLHWWNEKIARQRIHGSTQQQVWSTFEKLEKPALKPLPSEEFELFESGTRKVHFDSHISIDYSFYSVPQQFLRKEVKVHWNQKTVRIYYNHTLIRTHKKSHIRGVRVTEPSDIPEYLQPTQERYSQYLYKQSIKLGHDVSEWVKYMFEARKGLAFRVIQGVLGLGKKHSRQVLNEACRSAVSNNITHYKDIQKLCEQKTYQHKYQPTLFSENHEFLRSPAEYQHLAEEWDDQQASAQPIHYNGQEKTV